MARKRDSSSARGFEVIHFRFCRRELIQETHAPIILTFALEQPRRIRDCFAVLDRQSVDEGQGGLVSVVGARLPLLLTEPASQILDRNFGGVTPKCLF